MEHDASVSKDARFGGLAKMRPFVAVLLPLLLVVAGLPTTLRADVTAEQVRRAIDDGVVFLRHKQLNDGSWPVSMVLQAYSGGVTSLCTLSLLNAGVPPNDPMI